MDGLENYNELKHIRRIINMKKDKCERELLYPIIRFLWPTVIAVTLIGFIIFLKLGLIYEACFQAFTLLMQIYVWPKKTTLNHNLMENDLKLAITKDDCHSANG